MLVCFSNLKIAKIKIQAPSSTIKTYSQVFKISNTGFSCLSGNEINYKQFSDVMNNKKKDGFKQKYKRIGLRLILPDWFSISHLVRVVSLQQKSNKFIIQKNLVIYIILIFLWLFSLICCLSKEKELCFVSFWFFRNKLKNPNINFYIY